MTELERIAAFQARLLDALQSGRSLDDVIRELESDPAFEIFRERIARWDPRLIETGCELVRKWGRRSDR